jgi:uncharacterized glyoxalase superfamily protein PhnB
MSNEYPSANIDFRAVPVINVENVEASVAYYRDKLGFEMSWDTKNDDGQVVMAGLSRANAELFIDSRCKKTNFGLRLMIEIDPTDRLNELHEEFISRGAQILQPPTMQDWGWTVMTVTDLDGNMLDFCGDEIEELKPKD